MLSITMARRPPRPTLFPYTTLFRSPSLARAIVRRTRGRTHGPVTRLMSPSDFGEILKPFVFLDLFDHEGAPFKDRKSTRLNSSHPSISYAVFCSKKKIK